MQDLTWWPGRRRMPRTPGFLRAEVAETSASRTHLRERKGTVLPAFRLWWKQTGMIRRNQPPSHMSNDLVSKSSPVTPAKRNKVSVSRSSFIIVLKKGRVNKANDIYFTSLPYKRLPHSSPDHIHLQQFYLYHSEIEFFILIGQTVLIQVYINDCALQTCVTVDRCKGLGLCVCC